MSSPRKMTSHLKRLGKRFFDFILRNRRRLAWTYGLYVLYALANTLALSSGADPIYRLTGLSRTTQFQSVSMVFGILGLAILIGKSADKWRKYPVDPASYGSLRHGILLLFVLVFLNICVSPFRAVLEDVSSDYWIPLFTWSFLVLAVQALIVWTALALIRRPRIHLVLLAGLSTLNSIALYFALSGKFSALLLVSQTFVISIVFLLYLLLFILVVKRILPLGNVNLVLALSASCMFAYLAVSTVRLPGPDGDLPGFADVRFRAKPNIHILGIDSLIPGSLARKYMGLVNMPYSRLLKESGVVTYDNAFSSRVSTKQSLNSLMRLAHADFDLKRRYPYFSGRANGPVTQILRSNGYKIWTGYDKTYFGRKGPYVDFYVPEQRTFVQNALCTQAVQNPVKFFGICHIASLVTTFAPEQVWADKIVEIINHSIDEHIAPAFTLHYIYSPIGHTPLDFVLSDQAAFEGYIEHYRNGALEAAELMKRIHDLVENDNEPSIYIVLGDHGPYLSRFMKFEDDRTFFVQDRYGILVTILVNESGCSSEQLKHYTAQFASPARVLASLMRCLARDPGQFDHLMKFDEDYSFEDFLYE